RRSAARGESAERVVRMSPSAGPPPAAGHAAGGVRGAGDRDQGGGVSGPVGSIVVPAHNEEALLGRLLSRLLEHAGPDEFDIVVGANGCTDGTEAVAAGFAPRVRVVSTGIPSKRAALRLGDEAARGFPRLYVDGDVELGTAAARRLCAAVATPRAPAAAPRRALAPADRRSPGRSHYQDRTR